MNEILGSFLKTIAPTIATALLGPLGGVAVAAIGKIIGVDNASVAQVTKAFEDGKITPDHLAEIKKLELQYQNNEKERDFKYVDLVFQDTKSAREMQISTHSSTPTVLTYMITVGFFGILGWMLADETVINSPPLLIMLGSLGTAWTGCCAFWFGTTQGSQNKDKLLAQLTPK